MHVLHNLHILQPLHIWIFCIFCLFSYYAYFPSVAYFAYFLKYATTLPKCSSSKVTHLFNAMEPFHHRQPGLVGLLLREERLWLLLQSHFISICIALTSVIEKVIFNIYDECDKNRREKRFGLIVDGVHTCPEAVKLAYRTSPKRLVTV